MRDETTAPQGTDNRVKVFISSRCVPKEKYGTFRRALKKLLTETNLCSVFVFEEGGSSQTAEQYYLPRISQSDVVIFFVDNDFEKRNSAKKKIAPDGVLQEYQETKRQQKKHFFFYCGTEKHKTELQKEVEKDASAPKWLRIDDFTNAAEEIYTSVINDILQIYKNYCTGWLSYFENVRKVKDESIGGANAVAEISGDFITKEITSEISRDIKSTSSNSFLCGLNFNQFSQTYAVLAKVLKSETPDDFKRDYSEPMQTCALDMAIAPLFSYVIGHGNRDKIAWCALKAHITSLHNGTTAELVAKRMEVIEKYVNGASFDDLRFSVNDIHAFAKAHHFPNWLLFDILIDNSNINKMTAEKPWYEEQSWRTQEKIQEQLNEIKENYYPAIDRLEAEINRKCLDEQLKQNTKSLSARVYGERLWGMYELLKTFVIAISNGSLLQTFYTAIRLEKLLYSYMLKYSNREFYIEYVRVKLVMLNNLKELEAAIGERLRNDFNTIEAKSIWDSICSLPEYYSKTLVKYKSAKLLGDYFDDDTFEQISQWLLKKYGETINEIKNGNVRARDDDDIFETLAAIASRLTNQQRYDIITSVPINAWCRPSAKWLYKIWLCTMNTETYTPDVLEEYCKILMAIHKANAVQRYNADFLNVAIRVILSCRENMEINKYLVFERFLEENYSEVISDYTNPDLDARLVFRLDIIEKHAKKEMRSSGDISPVIEMLKIISAKPYNEIPVDLVKRMYSNAVSIVYSENEYISDNERLTALKILMVLVGRFKYDKVQLNQDIAHVPQTFGDDWPFSNSTPKAIVVGVYLLKATLGTIRPAELLLFFASIQDDSNTYASIDVIRYWVGFCGTITKPAYVETTLQYVISQLLGNDRSAIRRIASLMLVELCETKYDKLALDTMSHIMDSGGEGGTGASHADKAAKEVIVSSLHRFKRRNPKQVNYILAKAQSDTSWSVRNAAKIAETGRRDRSSNNV